MSDAPVVNTIGLISDTHFQDLLFELPQSLAQTWGQVDLILHAGDVGDLSVLDHLGQIAPVVAVHGNDEPPQTKQELPYQQLLTVHGLRLLLWHSHYPDPAEERLNRGGPWGPKLQRIGERGLQSGAALVIYGHTHVPMTYFHQGLALVNPGALASSSYFARPKIASIALLKIRSDQSYQITHFDLATGQPMEFPSPLPETSFSSFGQLYQEWLLEPDLIPYIPSLRQIPFENYKAVMHSFLPLYKRCLTTGVIQRQELLDAILSSPLVTPHDRQQVSAVLQAPSGSVG